MPRTITGGGSQVGNSGTGFGYFIGANRGASGTESQAARQMRIPGNLSLLGANQQAQTGTGRTFSTRKNSAAGQLIVNLADTVQSEVYYTGGQVDHYLATDTYDMRQASATGSQALNIWKHIFEADDGTHWAMIGGVMTTNPASASLFGSIMAFSETATESFTQTSMRTSGTLQWLAVATAFSLISSGSIQYNTRINGVSGAITVSIPTGSTGVFEDTTHTDTFNVNDLVCFLEANGNNTGTGGAQQNYMCWVQYNQQSQEIQSSITGTINPGLNWFAAIIGHYNSATENLEQIQHGIPVVGENFRTLVDINTCNGTTVMHTRINGVNGNQILTIPNATTGNFEDITRSDIWYPVNEATYLIDTTGSSGGGIRPLNTWMTESVPSFPTVPPVSLAFQAMYIQRTGRVIGY